MASAYSSALRYLKKVGYNETMLAEVKRRGGAIAEAKRIGGWGEYEEGRAAKARIVEAELAAQRGESVVLSTSDKITVGTTTYEPVGNTIQVTKQVAVPDKPELWGFRENANIPQKKETWEFRNVPRSASEEIQSRSLLFTERKQSASESTTPPSEAVRSPFEQGPINYGGAETFPYGHAVIGKESSMPGKKPEPYKVPQKSGLSTIQDVTKDVGDYFGSVAKGTIKFGREVSIPLMTGMPIFEAAAYTVNVIENRDKPDYAKKTAINVFKGAGMDLFRLGTDKDIRTAAGFYGTVATAGAFPSVGKIIYAGAIFAQTKQTIEQPTKRSVFNLASFVALPTVTKYTIKGASYGRAQVSKGVKYLQSEYYSYKITEKFKGKLVVEGIKREVPAKLRRDLQIDLSGYPIERVQSFASTRKTPALETTEGGLFFRLGPKQSIKGRQPDVYLLKGYSETRTSIITGRGTGKEVLVAGDISLTNKQNIQVLLNPEKFNVGLNIEQGIIINPQTKTFAGYKRFFGAKPEQEPGFLFKRISVPTAGREYSRTTSRLEARIIGLRIKGPRPEGWTLPGETPLFYDGVSGSIKGFNAPRVTNKAIIPKQLGTGPQPKQIGFSYERAVSIAEDKKVFVFGDIKITVKPKAFKPNIESKQNTINQAAVFSTAATGQVLVSQLEKPIIKKVKTINLYAVWDKIQAKQKAEQQQTKVSRESQKSSLASSQKQKQTFKPQDKQTSKDQASIFSEIKSKAKTTTVQTVRTNQRIVSFQVPISSQKQNVIQIPRIAQLPKQAQVPAQVPRIAQVPRQAQVPKQVPRQPQVLVPETVLVRVPRRPSTPRTPNKPRVPREPITPGTPPGFNILKESRKNIVESSYLRNRITKYMPSLVALENKIKAPRGAKYKTYSGLEVRGI